MKKLFRQSLIASSVALALFACQNIDEQAKKEKQDKDEKVVVTGSRVKRADVEDSSPVVVLGRESELNEAIEVKNRLIKTSKERRVAKSPPAQASYDSSIGFHYAQKLPINNEKYQHLEENNIKQVSLDPVSTFSIDVDTGSYSNVRRMLKGGYLPPKDAVRLEEMVNYFDYTFASPDSKEQPFSISTETMSAPWNNNAYVMQIGIKGFEPQAQDLPPSNLVFLIDVSGSMRNPNKLGLVKKSLKMLTRQMSSEDKVSLVVYAGASGVVLEPTSNKLQIEQALDKLAAGGSTNGAAGIELAYQMAQQAFIKGGINRVIVATDGDFNVGTTNHQQLMDLIERKRKTGVYFSALGFGQGNYNEHLMEQLANKGNGNYAYIDSLVEAKKVLVDQRAGTLMTIAKDVKIQVEFNPRVVSEYRLLGYENRALNREDFNNDKVDAGEIGAGHSITALYEVVLAGSAGQRVDDLRYQPMPKEELIDRRVLSEAANVKVRYKLPQEDSSKLTNRVVSKADFFARKANSNNIQFASSVAGFSQLLKGGKHLQDWSWQQAITSANNAKGVDTNGYRSEMVQLMKMAQLLEQQQMTQEVSQND